MDMPLPLCSGRNFGWLSSMQAKGAPGTTQKRANRMAVRALTMAKSRIGVLVWKSVWTIAVSAKLANFSPPGARINMS